MLWHVSAVCSFLLLGSILFYGYNIIHIYQLMDIYWNCFCFGDIKKCLLCFAHFLFFVHHALYSTVFDSSPSSVQFSSVTQSCPTLCDPMNHGTPSLPVHHQLLEFTQTQVHRVSDAIQPSHPLLSPSPLAPNPSQHQSLFQWVNSSHEVAKALEFQL